MAKPTVEEIVADLENVLKFANQVSYLWDQGQPLYGKDVTFTSTFVAPDESWELAVHEENKHFSFNTRYDGKNLSPLEASKALLNVDYIGKPGALIHDFKECLVEPLGRYFARREIARIEKGPD